MSVEPTFSLDIAYLYVMVTVLEIKKNKDSTTHYFHLHIIVYLFYIC